MLETIAQFQFYVKSRKEFNQYDIALLFCILHCNLKRNNNHVPTFMKHSYYKTETIFYFSRIDPFAGTFYVSVLVLFMYLCSFFY